VCATHILDSPFPAVTKLLSYGTCVFNCDVLKWVIIVLVYIILYSLTIYVCILYCDIFKEEGCGSGPGRHLFNIFCSEGGAYFKLDAMCNHSLRSRCGKW